MRVVDDSHRGKNPFVERALQRAQVAVVDDHVLVGRLVVGLLERAGYSAALALGNSIEDTWANVVAIAPDILLLDFELGPNQSSFAILERAVEAGLTVAGFTGSDDRIEQARFLEAGAAAIVPKESGPSDLVAVVELAVGGNELMAPADRHAALARLRKHREASRREAAVFELLTQREAETLLMIAEGHGAAEIAELWQVSMPTVRSHIRAVLTKLGVSSQLQAAAMARNSGWYDSTTSQGSSILTMPYTAEPGTITRRSGSQG
ncbi:MAG: response regulator transcription factor [Acidimicrobiia bacterium]|nr:response regulator transcription factor [Acidimicrobiia bacterium]